MYMHVGELTFLQGILNVNYSPQINFIVAPKQHETQHTNTNIALCVRECGAHLLANLHTNKHRYRAGSQKKTVTVSTCTFRTKHAL